PGPAVAAGAADEQVLGEGTRLGGVALLEAGPGQEALRPRAAARVAQLLEGGLGAVQQPLRLRGAPGVERAPRQVLDGPRLAPPVAERGEALAGVLEQRRRPGVVVAEEGGEALEAHDLGGAPLVAPASADGAGLGQGRVSGGPVGLLVRDL